VHRAGNGRDCSVRYLLLIALLALSPVSAQQDLDQFLYWYECHDVRVVDGDTADCGELRLGFNVVLTDIRFRLYGIDAWETRGSEKPKGLLAKQWLVDQIEGKNVIVMSIRDERGKFGRLLGVLWLGNVNLNERLVELGHAEFRDY